jgi:heptosyltransferase-2
MSERSILVIQTAFVGDVVLTTPLLRALKTSAPAVRLTVVTTPAGANLLEGSPFVDARIAYRKKGSGSGPLRLVRVLGALGAREFDVAVAAQRSFRSGILAVASRARLRIGFAKAGGAWAYTRRVPWEGMRHAVHRYLALARPLGLDPAAADPHPQLDPPEEARRRADALLREAGLDASGPLLAVAPGSVWGTKRWTPEGYGALLASSERRLGLRPFLVGSGDERPLCEAIAARSGRVVPDLAGRSDLSVLAALLARAAALVTNDSGPGHIASAVGTPVVSIFGPTVPEFGYTPFGGANRVVQRDGLSCRPCHSHGPERCPLGHHRCMTEIDARAVLATLESLLAETGGDGRPQGTEAVRPG